MALWRERGVVPDSEDEFDSESDYGAGPGTSVNAPSLPTGPPTISLDAPVEPSNSTPFDVWDIPGSSQPTTLVLEPRPRPVPNIPPANSDIQPSLDPSSPLSWRTTSPSLSGSPILGGQRGASQDDRQLPPQSSYPDDEPESQLPQVESDATVVPEAHQPESDVVMASDGHPSRPSTPQARSRIPQSQALVSSLSSPPTSIPHNNPLGQPGLEQPSNATKPQLETTEEDLLRFQNEDRRRIFRPRKPIQEHPYLLEIAKYNQQLKSHGVKPLRMADSSQSSSRHQAGQDSQDNDFEDDSQDANLPGDDLDNLVVGAEELNLLSSTSKPAPKPRQLAGLQNPLGQSLVVELNSVISPSQESDDLPSIAQISTTTMPRAGKRSLSPNTVRQYKRARLPALPRAESPDELALDKAGLSISDHIFSSSPPISASVRRFRPSQSTLSLSRSAVGTSAFTTINETPSKTTTTSHIYDTFNDTDDEELGGAPTPTQQKTRPVTLIIPSSPPPLPQRGANSEARRSPSPTRTRRLRRQDLLNAGIAPDIGTNKSNEDKSDDDNDGEQESQSENEVDQTLKRFGRRLRGVLPPSYLRLADQLEKQRQAAATATTGSRPRGGSPKRGVAQTRTGGTHAHADFLQMLADSDDDDDAAPTSASLGAQPAYVQTSLPFDSVEVGDFDEGTPGSGPGYDNGGSGRQADGDSSDMEEDFIDRMFSASRKRSSALSLPKSKTGQKRQKMGSSKFTNAPRNQPSITSHFASSHSRNQSDSSRPKASSSSLQASMSRYKTASSKSKGNRSQRHSQPRKKRPPPPRLSILDTCEPDAPRFVRVAARSSKRAVGNGRASPSKKVFQLANRWDNREVNQVLHNWREGRIKQRDLPPPRHRARSVSRLGGASASSASRPVAALSSRVPAPSHAAGGPREDWLRGDEVMHVHTISNANEPAESIPQPAHPGLFISAPHAGLRRKGPVFNALPTGSLSSVDFLHPVGNIHKTATFQAGIRMLDDLYKKTKKTAPPMPPSIATAIPSKQPGASPPSRFDLDDDVFDLSTDLSRPAETATRKRHRIRKQYRPHHVDVQAPQFSRSNDPLPPILIDEEEPVPVDPTTMLAQKQQAKLVGLGPYGTHYTQHFDIFPLNSNVYFHPDTLLGQGLVDRATERHDVDQLRKPKPSASFLSGSLCLQWGQWDDKVSSEFGMLFDAIADNIAGPSEEMPMPDFTMVEAADFVLGYVQNSISFADSAAELSFSARIVQVFRSFHTRLELLQLGTARCTVAVKLVMRLIIALFTAHHMCKNSPSLLSDALSVERVLVDVVKALARLLLQFGMRPLHEFYAETQRETASRRPIRPSRVHLQAWVVLMRIMEVSSIPRMSFWDAVYAVLLTPDDAKCVSVARFEYLWEAMFSLLPLREFDSLGAMVPGIRRARPMDGWALPQKLIRRVFDVYTEGVAQAASFNEYCRALVGRCHYLIDEWGWVKCHGMVGAIFDFFGAQNLSHLRNEDAFKSPRFLDDLCSSAPALAIERGDRCFHVFLKTVAVAIRRLTERGAANEVRNLITRIMPNHNRQFLKDQTLHHTDLASLRNHHDLLCTIFWAAPADLRPAVPLIAKLVTPAESHKEACLVNLRAWNQLARFVAATNTDARVFRAFLAWQNNVFQQLLDQHESVASDMQAQLLALPHGSSHGVNQAKMDMFVALNRAAIKDMLYFSAKASQDILRHSRSRDAAVFALNTYQLNNILRQFTYAPPLLDWTILTAALGTLSVFLRQRSDATGVGSGGGGGGGGCNDTSLSALDAERRSDAILIQRELADNLFAAARTFLTDRDTSSSSSSSARPPRQHLERSTCGETLVVLCARATTLLSRIGAVRVSDIFSATKWGLFEGPIQRLPLAQRQYVPLYLATQLGEAPADIEPQAMSLLNLWVQSVVKPYKYVVYEHLLASELLRRNKPYVAPAAVTLAASVSYGALLQLFEYTLSWMRTTLRNTPMGAARRDVSSSFSAALRLAMDQVKADLQTLSPQPTLHEPYVLFIRQVMSLVRSHAGDFCVIDPFFYQISKDYSPPLQDPKLHVAGMVSYGLRLADGDARVVPQLFHYLYNSFKVALVNNGLGREATMVRRGMKHAEIRSFVLSKMLPAAVKAALRTPQAFFLVECYSRAAMTLFSKPVLPPELSLDDMKRLLFLVECLVSELYALFRAGSADVSVYVVQSVQRCVELVHVLWPLVHVHVFFAESKSVYDAILKELGRFSRATRAIESAIDGWLELGTVDMSLAGGGIDPSHREKLRGEQDANVLSFAAAVEADIKRSWDVRGGRLFIRGAGSARPGAGGPPGYQMPHVVLGRLLETLRTVVAAWNHEWTAVATPELVRGGKSILMVAELPII